MTVPHAARSFYRCFSNSSAGGLVSGKGKGGRRLSTRELQSEFRSHQTFNRTQPKTALISVTDNFIEVLRRAFDKLYEGDDSDQIWIAFISVPYIDKGAYHHAEHLAQEIGQDKTGKFKNEYIFVWEIPEKYIVHKVSVQTLQERGLDMEPYCEDSNGRRLLPSTYLLKQKVAEHILDSDDGYDIGLTLGFMARHFGARAAVCDIAHQILFECTWTAKIDYDAQYVRVPYGNGHEKFADFERLYWIDRGIEEAFDSWLSDLQYKEHCEWVSRLENERADDIWECMDDDNVSHFEQRQRLLQAREDEIHAEIEITTTQLGL